MQEPQEPTEETPEARNGNPRVRLERDRGNRIGIKPRGVSYAAGGERPSVPPADLYNAPWRVAQRKELKELQRGEKEEKEAEPLSCTERYCEAKERTEKESRSQPRAIEAAAGKANYRPSPRPKRSGEGASVKVAQQPRLHGERRRVALSCPTASFEATVGRDTP